MIRGIGPAYAKKLLRAFGENVFDIIEATPDARAEAMQLFASAPRPQPSRSGRSGHARWASLRPIWPSTVWLSKVPPKPNNARRPPLR
jgi:hypothetical protein